MLKKMASATLAAVTLFAAPSCLALPTNVYIDNGTDVTLDAYTAGQPGASVPANTEGFAIPYIGVIARCNMGGVPNNCPIEFYDHEKGDKVASVSIDIWKGKVNGAPVFYGDHATRYTITGWDEVPVTRITVKNAS